MARFEANGLSHNTPSDNGEEPMKKKQRSTTRPSKSAAPATDGGGDKKSKAPHVIQGVRVMTPGGKKPGKRGAAGLLKLSQIKVVKGFNPRTAVGDVTELERSIRKAGLLHPLVVRPSRDGKGFELVAGERRYVALKNLGAPFTDSVPVNIRVDLAEDDLAAKAVAVAENSEDGRTNLTYVEIGRVVETLVKKKWPLPRIASETGLHPKKVRRALDLVSAPEALVERVHKGELLPIAALEIAKLTEAQQAEVLERVGPGATVAEVRSVRKDLERKERREAVSQGEDRGKTKAGKTRERVATAWKPAGVKQVCLRGLCHTFVNADEAGTDSWHELRGAIAALLWDRGDIESPMLPSVNTEIEKDPSAAKAANVLFDGLVKNEASLHAPEDEAEEAEDAAPAKKSKSKKPKRKS